MCNKLAAIHSQALLKTFRYRVGLEQRQSASETLSAGGKQIYHYLIQLYP